MRRALLDHFSFQRRQFGQPVTLGEVMAVIQRIPGVVGVDVRALYRPDLPGVDGLQRSLPAALPRPGSSGAVTPAVLLTLGRSVIELGAT